MANDTTVKFRADISSLKSEMQAAARAVKMASAEFKAATAGMDDWAKSADGLEAKIKQLNTVLDVQKQNYERQKTILEETEKAYGKNSAAADRERTKLLNMEAAYKTTEAELKQYTKQLELVDDASKDAADGTNKYASASEKLKATIDKQERELEQLKKAYADVALEEGASSDEAKELAKQIDSLSGELQENKNDLESAEKAADQFDKTLDESAESADKAKEGFTVMKGVLADLAATAIRACIEGLKDLAVAAFDAGSNFEAGMSKVQAISGASTADMQKLTDKAKMMGETTKFSATESAEALQYMAMAGWKTEDMLNGIEGIMNLAAASGEDLATTSDIVTDAMTAFGYGAEEAGHFADVLAAAASNSNTNVAMLGESFKYAAPIAGSLGYSVEDVAVALGLMANSGIKASMAGTSLRNILQRMAKPTKDSEAAMERLGVSLDDGNGHMYSLMEIMEQLRDSFGEINMSVAEYDREVELLDSALEDGTLTQKKYDEALEELNKQAFGAEGAEKARAAAMLGGARALSGLLAISEASEEDFEKLTAAIDGSTGAAENMAQVMNDNVQGQITLLESNVEGKMIRVFERASGSIKNAIKSISGALDNLDWNKIGDAVGKIAEKVAKFIEFLIKNGPTIASILKTIATVFVAYKTVTVVSSLVSGFMSLMSVVQATGSVVKAFMLILEANPIGLAVAAVAGLVAVLWQLESANRAAIESEYGLTDSEKELINSVNASKEAYDQLDEARKASMQATDNELGYYQLLKDEFNSLVDENGKVKTGYEDRANFILTTLSEALGIEMEKLQEEIALHGKLGESIDQVIEKKRAEAYLSANQQMYTEAIQNQNEALTTYQSTVLEAKDAEEAYKQAQDESAKALEYYNGIVDSYPEGIIAASNALEEATLKEQAAKERYEELSTAVVDAEDVYVGYVATIQNYEGLSAAIIANDADSMESSMEKVRTSFITAEAGTKESLERQVQNYQDSLAAMKQAVADGTPGITEQMLYDTAEMVAKAKIELHKGEQNAREEGEYTAKGYGEGLVQAGDLVTGNAKTLLEKAETATKDTKKMHENGTKTGEEYAKAIDETKPKADSAGQAITFSAANGALIQAGQLTSAGILAGSNYAGGVRSKASDANAAGTEIGNSAEEGAKSVSGVAAGEFYADGYIEGMLSKEDEVRAAGKTLAKAAEGSTKKEQKSESPSKKAIALGSFFGEGYAIGIDNMIRTVAKAASDLVKTAFSTASDDGEDFEQIGLENGKQYATGLSESLRYVKDSILGFSAPLNDLTLSGKMASSAVNASLSENAAGSASAAGQTGPNVTSNNVTFNQYNNSPKSLDRLSIYRDTNALLFDAKVRLGNV